MIYSVDIQQLEISRKRAEEIRREKKKNEYELEFARKESILMAEIILLKNENQRLKNKIEELTEN